MKKGRDRGAFRLSKPINLRPLPIGITLTTTTHSSLGTERRAFASFLLLGQIVILAFHTRTFVLSYLSAYFCISSIDICLALNWP